MVGVGEDDARAQFLERLLRESFDRCGRAYRHEYRRLDDPVRRSQLSAPRAGRVSLQYSKGKAHAPSVSGENEGPEHLNDNKYAPNRKCNDIGFAALQFSRVDRREADRKQNQHPDCEDVDGFA